MSIYYLEYMLDTGQREVFSFDSTSEITLDDNGSATSFKLASGASVADHYINNNVMIFFKGTITDIKSAAKRDNPEQLKDTQTFLASLRRLKSTGSPFTIYTSTSMGVFRNCVFETLSIKQGKGSGTVIGAGGRQVSSFKISFSAKEIRFSRAIQSVVLRDEIIEMTTQPERPKAGQKQGVTEERKRIEAATFNILNRPTLGNI